MGWGDCREICVWRKVAIVKIPSPPLSPHNTQSKTYRARQRDSRRIEEDQLIIPLISASSTAALSDLLQRRLPRQQPSSIGHLTHDPLVQGVGSHSLHGPRADHPPLGRSLLVHRPLDLEAERRGELAVAVLAHGVLQGVSALGGGVDGSGFTATGHVRVVVVQDGLKLELD